MTEPGLTPDEYCREIEAYLCRKNDGHLIRIVGPAFGLVCGWAERGIPIKIAYQGIDRYFVRYYAKGPRRRPVQIDFCDADVLDAFDEWRRAVGVRLPGAEPSAAETAHRKRQSLPEHFTRVLERITARLAGKRVLSAELRVALEAVADRVSELSNTAGPIRGEARAQALASLTTLDQRMLEAVWTQGDAVEMEAIRKQAAAELAPFRERMPAEAFARAASTAADRILREREDLPTITFE